MFNKKIKMMLLLVLLTSLLIGITSAANVSKDDSNKLIQKQENKIITKTVNNTGTTSKIKTKLTLNKIKNTQYKKNTTITGSYEDANGRKLKNTLLQIKVNNKTYKTKTNNKGTYKYTIRANTPGTNKVIISYPGNKRYTGTSIKDTFQVTSKATQIKLDKVPDTYYNTYTNISGYYQDKDQNILKNTILTIQVNNKKYHAKTDKNGHFNYKYKAKTIGNNNITVSYNGNQKYAKTETKTVFNVKINPTHIKLNTISATKYKENMTISGKYLDAYNKALINTRLKININGKNYTTKTDKNGLFKRNIMAKKTGKHNITVSYNGNSYYSPAKASTTINVTPLKTRIILNKTPVDIKAEEYLFINGSFVDEKGNTLKNTFLDIYDEGYTHVNTDDNGEIFYDLYPRRVEQLTMNISFRGNDNYYPSSVLKTFNVGKMDTEIIIDNIGIFELGKNVSVDGYVYPSSEYINNMPIEITVNNKDKRKIRLDNLNSFNIKFKADTVGVNNITVKYFGNNESYNSSETKTFYVYDVAESSLTIPYTNDSVIDKGYETYSMNDFVGDESITSDISLFSEYGMPVHKFVKAKFYLKDDKGNIITMMDTYKDETRISVTHSKKFTPYKVDLTMKKLTDFERENYVYL
ncbi:MAG: hypothetical protein IJI98_09210 [Methanosphaera sp.]|nr:hypothetical protein [Methanosphaera sp.]